MPPSLSTPTHTIPASHPTTSLPICSNCHTSPAAQCARCTSTKLIQHRTSHASASASRDRHLQRATTALLGEGGVEEVRVVRARAAEVQREMAEIEKERARLEEENAALTSQMHALRTSLTSRRANLAIPPHTLVATPESWTERRALIAEELEQTRRVLVSELMEVFHVRRVDAEPEEDDEDDDDDVEDDEGDEEWVIGSGKGVVLPSPEEIDVYPSLETQAALLHTSHLLRLLSLYTSHSLPTPLPSPAPPPAPKPTTLSIRPPTIAQTTYHAAHLLASLGIPLAPPPPGELSSSPSPFRPSPPEEDRKQRRNSPSVLRALAGIAEGEWGPPLTLGRGASPEESVGGSGSSSKRRDKSSKDHPEEETKEERRARRRERKERKERKEREAASKKAAASGSGRLDEWEVVDGGVG